MSENRDQHNHGGMLAFIFSMVFVLVFFIYIVAIHPGVDLKENLQVPAAPSTLMAEGPVDISGIKEPWAANELMVKHGKAAYKANCAVCHGDSAMGDGPGGAALNPKPRNLLEGPWKKGGGYIGWYTVLRDGLEGTAMASFKHLKKEDRWAMVQFIDSITKAKVQEDPAKVAEFAKTAE